MADDSLASVDDLSDLLFGVRRSIRYHNRRRAFFDGLSKFSSFLKVFGGTATLTTVLAKGGDALVTSFATLVAGLSAMDLIVQTSTAARTHNDLAKRFNALERKMIVAMAGPVTKTEYAKFCAERLEIEADEPPIKRNLDSACHNELCRAMDCEDAMVQLKWYQKGVMAHLIDIQDFAVRKQSANAVIGS